MLRASVVCMVLALAGCASPSAQRQAAWQPTMTLVQADQRLINEATEAVRGKLKDPDSAKFSGIYATSKPEMVGDPIVCGLVNAKNSYGGYVGNVMFAYGGEKAVFIQEASVRGRVPLGNSLIRDLCTIKKS